MHTENFKPKNNLGRFELMRKVDLQLYVCKYVTIEKITPNSNEECFLCMEKLRKSTCAF